MLANSGAPGTSAQEGGVTHSVGRGGGRAAGRMQLPPWSKATSSRLPPPLWARDPGIPKAQTRPISVLYCGEYGLLLLSSSFPSRARPSCLSQKQERPTASLRILVLFLKGAMQHSGAVPHCLSPFSPPYPSLSQSPASSFSFMTKLTKRTWPS